MADMQALREAYLRAVEEYRRQFDKSTPANTAAGLQLNKRSNGPDIESGTCKSCEQTFNLAICQACKQRHEVCGCAVPKLSAVPYHTNPTCVGCTANAPGVAQLKAVHNLPWLLVLVRTAVGSLAVQPNQPMLVAQQLTSHSNWLFGVLDHVDLLARESKAVVSRDVGLGMEASASPPGPTSRDLAGIDLPAAVLNFLFAKRFAERNAAILKTFKKTNTKASSALDMPSYNMLIKQLSFAPSSSTDEQILEQFKKWLLAALTYRSGQLYFVDMLREMNQKAGQLASLAMLLFCKSLTTNLNWLIQQPSDAKYPHIFTSDRRLLVWRGDEHNMLRRLDAMTLQLVATFLLSRMTASAYTVFEFMNESLCRSVCLVDQHIVVWLLGWLVDWLVGFIWHDWLVGWFHLG